MDTGQRSKASGSTVWLVYAQVFFVISQACDNPETPVSETSSQHSRNPPLFRQDQLAIFQNTPQCSETSSQHSRTPHKA